MADTTIELSFPVDVAAAIWGRQRGEVSKEERISALLAVGLFAEGTVSLARAAHLAHMGRMEFALHLKRLGFPAYEYTDTELEEDISFVASMVATT